MFIRRILTLFFITAGFVFAEETEVVFSEVSLVKGSDDLIYLSVRSEEAIAGLQFEVAFDPSVIEMGVPTLSTRNHTFSLKAKRDSASLKVMAFSMEGETLDLEEPVLMIPLSAKGDYEGKLSLDVKNFILSRPDGNKVSLRVSAGQIYVVPSVPSRFTLNENFPNPFNEQTVIRFDLPESALVSLVIYDIEGKRIRTLEDHSVLSAGYHAKPWDGLDNNGDPVSSGEYVCSLKVGINYQAIKMVLLR
ncbi:MAG: hypothetical protein CMG71_05960 [Candidatus Marinimicrobia bacterium]|nr:hypothetical protein [Candidatus Neomarinimicrobiota bacterium]|tara:strand:+ start:3940 stop:4683 length:744 start_codon:yes stop_codon:yes gene_type:complete